MNYTIYIEKDEKSGWYVGQCEQIPEAISQGRTKKELMENMRDAIALAVQSIKEDMQSHWAGRQFVSQRLSVSV